MADADNARLLEQRCPGPSYQDIIGRDAGYVPEVLTLQANPAQPVAPVAFERYTSPAFFDLEMARMWRKVWLYACREEHLPEVGDYFVYDIGRFSILITRTDDGLKAYHNSCTHRGTKLKPSGSSGWSSQIQCPFHGWTWHLDGSIKDIPCRWEFGHVADRDAGLREVQVDVWNSFVFVTMDRNAPPLLDYLEVMPEHFRNWDMSGWTIYLHVQKELPANWKLANEAFMEAYHTPFVHPDMTHVVGDINMQHDVFGPHVSRDLCPMATPSPMSTLKLTEQEMLDRMLVADRSLVGDRAMVPEGGTARGVMAGQMRELMQREYGLDFSGLSDPEIIDSIKYNLFPNLLITAGVSFRQIYTFRPLGHDHDRTLFDLMIMKPAPKDGPCPPPAEPIRIGEDQSYSEIAGMDPFYASVLDQDTNIMRWQREGMYASETGGALLSNYQESRIRHVHMTLDSYLARE